MASGRKVTGALLRKVNSTWVHPLMFRRPLLALMNKVYKAQPAVETDPVVMELPAAAAANELALLGCLSVVMVTDLSAAWALRILATDVSTFALGSAVAFVPSSVHREIWRHRDARGKYTWLYSRHLEELCSTDQDACLDIEALFEASEPSPGRVLIELAISSKLHAVPKRL